MTFSARVRDELAQRPTDERCCRIAEASSIVRFAGALELRGGHDDIGVVLPTASAAVARRLVSVLRDLAAGDVAVEAHRPSGLHRHATYRVRLTATNPSFLHAAGLVDEAGRPSGAVPEELTRRSCCRTAYLRGALMSSGRWSDPHAAPHLEVGAESEAVARHLETLMQGLVGRGRATPHGDGWRVVVKSGAVIGDVLARVGAHAAFLEWDEGRLRRELRAAANRVANADQVNLRRAVGAAAQQIASIQRLVGSEAWEELPQPLKDVGLARLANPEASLAELGALLDPPIGKATVHRRLARLMEASGVETPGGGGAQGVG